MVEQGRKGCEFGAASVLDPLAKIPGCRNPLGFLMWDGAGRWGGEGGEKNRDREHRCFLFSQKLSFHVSMLHVCSEIFIFFLFLFFLVLGLVWCCIC